MKNKISAKIVADSINPQGNRITTYELIYPRFIHGEVLTHRMFSKNSASSRAIPFKKMKEMVINDPFIPIAWQKDHKGMQGVEYITDNKKLKLLTSLWLRARDKAVEHATYINDAGATKQLCNRLLEPFMWHKVLLTATEFENFFNLRCPVYGDSSYGLDKCNITFKSKKDYCKYFNIDINYQTDIQWYSHNYSQAEIHIQALAEAMWDAMNESTPKQLKAGEWHMPYGNNVNYEQLGFDTAQYYKDNPNEVVDIDKWVLKVATARCARLSYQTVGDNPKIDYAADIKLHDMLLTSKHFSPFEHCQRAMTEEEYESFIKGEINPGFDIPEKTQGWCDNMKGFISYRYLLENNLKL